MLIDKNYLESLTIDSLTKLENLIKREKKIRKGVFKDKITSIILNKLLNNSSYGTNLFKYLAIVKGEFSPLKNIVESKELNKILTIEIQKFLAKINIEDLLVFNEKNFLYQKIIYQTLLIICGVVVNIVLIFVLRCYLESIKIYH